MITRTRRGMVVLIDGEGRMRNGARQVAIKAFEIDCGAGHPKAVIAMTVEDADLLLDFDKYPVEHGVHLRTVKQINRYSRPSLCPSK